MKKHSTIIRTLAAIVMAGAALVSCSKEKEAVTGTFTMTIEASMGDNATKGLTPGEGNTIAATWETTDEVAVYNSNNEQIGTLTATNISTEDASTCTLTGTVEGDVTTPLTLKYRSPNYTSQDGTLATIAATCDYATATVTGVTVSGSNITATDNVVFENQQAIIKFTLLDKANDAAISPSALTVTDGTSTVSLTSIPATTYATNDATNVLYVAFPAAGEAKTITLTATVGDDTYTYEKSGVTFANGHYYTIAVKMTKQVQTPEGAISGLFTVSVTGGVAKQVWFSQGNLQYNGGNSTWRFAEHQYDCVGSWNTSNWVDLFGWGTWTGSASNPMNTNENSEYSFAESDFDQTLHDSDAWRTLTNAEWGYLFNSRSGATVNGTSGRRYTMATVNSVKGIILLPDDATFESGEAVWGTFNAASNYTTTCTTAQWSGLEAKGCVFLPAAGSRDGTSLSSVGAQGHYWSSTPHNGVSNNAYFLFFRTTYVITQVNGYRYYGKCVRLVQDKN